MENLSLSCIQSALYWKDIRKNHEHFEKKITSIAEPSDIIVLPEMFTTGFIMEPAKFAEKMDGQTVTWMKKIAAAKNALLIGSIIIEEENLYYNRLLAVFPDGNIEYYNKRHLFAMAGEDKHYQQGDKNLIFKHKDWRIKTLICYDLRFPVWSRNQDSYDLLIYVANWPSTRSFHWKILLQARAIENQAYVAGVNRVGLDGNKIPHSGDCCVFDPLGHLISSFEPDEEKTETIVLNKSHLKEIRKKLPFAKDSDSFRIG